MGGYFKEYQKLKTPERFRRMTGVVMDPLLDHPKKKSIII